MKLEEQNNTYMEKTDKLQRELDETKEENYKIKKTVINKDNEIHILQEVLGKEKERRDSEVGEIKKMFYIEQDRCMKAIREAEGYSAKIDVYKDQSEKGDRLVATKDRKIEELNLELHDLRKS
mmetsp:Transcript_17537/g.16760  ORF Transcript_17537/g.16760 Transcript_17537/m.16760 type:complete len:123 (+) Transcript_17537:175-543(+)